MNHMNTSTKPLRYITSGNPRVPKVDFPFRHVEPLQIRFTDVDVFGHVNNNVYMAMMDLGKLSYYNAVMDGNLDYRNIAMVVVNVNCSFFAPTYISDHIEVWTSVASVGEHSFTLEQRIIDSDSGEVKCMAQSVLCAISSDGVTAPLDPEWIASLERYEERPIRHK